MIELAGMRFPYRAPFPMAVLVDRALKQNPAEIGMNDNQYSWYASLSRTNKKDVNSIPIVFLDAPRAS
jgi:hypothetical protein